MLFISFLYLCFFILSLRCLFVLNSSIVRALSSRKSSHFSCRMRMRSRKLVLVEGGACRWCRVEFGELSTIGEVRASYVFCPFGYVDSVMVRTVVKALFRGFACWTFTCSARPCSRAWTSDQDMGTGAGGGMKGRNRSANCWRDMPSSFPGAPSRCFVPGSALLTEA